MFSSRVSIKSDNSMDIEDAKVLCARKVGDTRTCSDNTVMVHTRPFSRFEAKYCHCGTALLKSR